MMETTITEKGKEITVKGETLEQLASDAYRAGYCDGQARLGRMMRENPKRWAKH